MKRGVSLYGSALVLTILLAAAGCARPRNDAQIASDVQQKIYGDPTVRSRQLTIRSSHGVVTLYGPTASDAERFTAAADAATVEGVRTVVNNLQVVPAAQAQVVAPVEQAAKDARVAAQPSAPGSASAAQPAVSVPPRAAEPSTIVPQTKRSARQLKMERTTTPLVFAKRNEVKKSAARPTTTPANQSSGLPYSTAAPASSSVGANPLPSQPAKPDSNAGQRPIAATGQTVAGANPESVKPAAAPTSAAPTAPASAAPAAATPVAIAPVPPAAPKPVTIAAGTNISVRLLDRVDSEKNHPGDSFRATLDAPLVDDSGATVIPAGYEVTGKIVEAKSAGRFAGNSALALELTQLSVNGKEYSLRTNQYTRKGKSRGKSTVEKVGGGAALGAILGGIFGGAKGAAIGATVGAGAGTGVSAAGKGEQVVLRSETALNFELQSPLSVVPTTQSPHGSRLEQDAANTSGNSNSNEHSSAAEDGPPVLKRRSQ